MGGGLRGKEYGTSRTFLRKGCKVKLQKNQVWQKSKKDVGSCRNQREKSPDGRLVRHRRRCTPDRSRLKAEKGNKGKVTRLGKGGGGTSDKKVRAGSGP